ncbi:MAG: 50S ribosomal protein L6 [Planctomycetes bacterium]|nr:50S ribosomal protein L6 [Planctomycetota bacterium]
MSRIGKIPVPVPAGVTVSVDGATLKVKGPKGELARTLDAGVTAKVENGNVVLSRAGDEQTDRARHGLYRALVKGMVEGVTQGFEKRLEIVGVSYQAKLAGRTLTLSLGFCNPVVREVPKGLTVEVPQPTMVIIRGHDKQLVGQFAAEIRRIRPPEPYKGKGVRYVGEKVVQKAGKSFVGGEK